MLVALARWVVVVEVLALMALVPQALKAIHSALDQEFEQVDIDKIDKG